MALSPWSVAPEIEYGEIARILAGHDPKGHYSSNRGGPKHPSNYADVLNWKRLMIEAVGCGDLQAEMIMTYRYPIDSDHAPKAWFRDDATTLYQGIYETDEIRMMIHRTAITRWLKDSGHADKEIPAALRIMKSGRQMQSGELNTRRETTYQRIIAALLAVQYSSSELEEPYRLADQLLDDCQSQDVKAPASRNTLGDIFKKLPRVQQAPLD